MTKDMKDMNVFNAQVRVLPAMVLPMPKWNTNSGNQNGRKDSASGLILAISLDRATLNNFFVALRTSNTLSMHSN